MEKAICNLRCKYCFVGFSVFVVGVVDVDYNEFVNIVSKLSERYVFIVDDFEFFEKIEDNFIIFVCEIVILSKLWFKWIYNFICFEK